MPDEHRISETFSSTSCGLHSKFSAEFPLLQNVLKSMTVESLVTLYSPKTTTASTDELLAVALKTLSIVVGDAKTIFALDKFNA